jgi:hypothetical protein
MSQKFYRMKPALLALLLAFTCSAGAQDRSAELDKAVEEARAAYLALQQAVARRDQVVALEPQSAERSAAAGASRPNENELARQALLEGEVVLAQRRYDAAMKRWNDLK